MMRILKRVLAGTLSVLLPLSCIACGTAGESGNTTVSTNDSAQTEPDVTEKEYEKITIPSYTPIITVKAREDAVFNQTPETYAPYQATEKDGVYLCSYEAWGLAGNMTTMQLASGYTPRAAVNSDSVMIYSTDPAVVNSWTDQGIYNVDMMTAINRADMDYFEGHPERYDDVQCTQGEGYLKHPAGQSYYMVPTAEFIEYLWNKIEWSITEYNPVSIALEEPEMWTRSGYSESFKKEWRAYFQEEWQRQNSSPEAMMKSMELKTYLFQRMITVISERLHAIAPETKLYIASHSTINYNEWDITAGLNHFLATGVIDGIIGQTWSDTARGAFAFEGSVKSDPFMKAFVEYVSYIDAVEGLDFFALADPRSDEAGLTDSQNRSEYLDTVVTSLLCPEIHRFEICPWVHRAFVGASDAYRTIQMQCYNALNMVGGAPVELEAGTPGIFYALSDTISWQKRNNWTNDTIDSVYGVTMPLVDAGIPLGMKSLEQIQTADDLADVQLLIVGYDIMLPMKEEINIAIAEWVKNGGNLLMLAGCSDFWSIEGRYWSADGSPIANLFRHLGLDSVTMETDIRTENAFTLDTHGSLAELTASAPFEKRMQPYTVAFDGVSDPILTVEGKNMGFSQAVGKGHITAVGLTSIYFSQSAEAAAFLRVLVRDALKYSEVSYLESDAMISRRAGVTAVHMLHNSMELPGRYLDLFDESLTVLNDPNIAACSSHLLYDITDLDLTVPRLGFTGGKLLSENGNEVLEETAERTSFSYTAVTQTIIATRILAPQGRYPSEITVVSQGEALQFQRVWDNDSASLLLLVDGRVAATEITVQWSDQPISGDLK